MNPFDILKNAGQIKEQAEQLQAQLSAMSTEGSSGGKMVVVTINGKMEMTDIKLDPLCVDNRDIKMLEDLIVAAHHDAMTKMQENIKAQLGPLMQGIPGLSL